MTPRARVLDAWKIIERRGDEIRTLFHGYQGSRVLPRGRWLRCREATVRDGSSRAYRSGWHVLPSEALARQYLAAFKRQLDVVPCEVAVVRPKPGGRHGVLLARWIHFKRSGKESVHGA